MTKVSVDIPEKMKEKIESLSEEKMYKSTSEYIRDALRKQIQEDSELSDEEEEIIIERMENSDKNYFSIEEAQEKLGMEK
jgi:Arc/MetJ-type ribon-helix-helix transcriptional regulator